MGLFILYSFLSLSFLHLDFTFLGDNVTCTLQMDICFRKPGFDWGEGVGVLNHWLSLAPDGGLFVCFCLKFNERIIT